MSSDHPPAWISPPYVIPPPNASSPDVPMQYGQSQTPGNVIYVGAPPQQSYRYTTSPTRRYQNYSSRQSLSLGVTMVVCGILCIIFNAVAIGLNSLLSPIGYGIWGGIWVVTFMVLSILSSIESFILVILAAVSAGVTADACGYRGDYIYSYYGSFHTRRDLSSSDCQGAVAMESLQAILAFIVGIASIWGAVLCCMVACCCNNNGQRLTSAPIIPMQGTQQVPIYSQQQQQQQYYTYPPGSYLPPGYPVYPGYPAPIMTNSEMGVVNSGYADQPMYSDSNNTTHEGFSNPSNNESAPPGYDENKG